MKKTTPPKSAKKNGKGPSPLPEDLTSAVVEAVLEDVVYEAAADAAAMDMEATLDLVSSPVSEGVVVAAIVPETPEEEEILELTNVPFLGPTRARALADVGIRTLMDLHTASPEQIGGVKGVGLRNAERIKEWLAGQIAVDPGPPPPPPVIEVLVSAIPPVASISPDPVHASANQDIFDGLGELDQYITAIRDSLGAKTLSKGLARQFDKASTVASELVEGPDTLSVKALQRSVKTLQKMVSVLAKAAAGKNLSEKKQDALADTLRVLRKELEKRVGD